MVSLFRAAQLKKICKEGSVALFNLVGQQQSTGEYGAITLCASQSLL